MKFIPVGKPVVYPVDYLRVGKALFQKQLSGYSEQYLPRFENEFAKVAGTSFSCAVNSGTSAIYLALAALELPLGTPVAVSTYTNMATIFPILQLGLIPVPIDVENVDFNMDPNDLFSIINSKFGAIVVVHIFGKPANMDAIMSIAEKFKIPVIEDCAQAHGAKYGGKKVGSFGKAGCFSFYSNKIISTGEGGAISTDDPNFHEILSRMKSLSFGYQSKFLHESDGYNFRMTNLQAALGLSQISNIEKVLMEKKRIADKYHSLLSNSEYLKLPRITHQGDSVTWMYHLTLNCQHLKCRNLIINEMQKRKIELRPGFTPFSEQQKVLEKYKITTRKTPVASQVGNSAFYLPTFTGITLREQNRVCENLLEIVKKLH